ncbi:MAG TPA: hypothetical protein VM925_11470 [Labilithrix sp.]|nr:hypothetical protein [Labilithrix sp.]
METPLEEQRIANGAPTTAIQGVVLARWGGGSRSLSDERWGSGGQEVVAHPGGVFRRPYIQSIP